VCYVTWVIPLYLLVQRNLAHKSTSMFTFMAVSNSWGEKKGYYKRGGQHVAPERANG